MFQDCIYQLTVQVSSTSNCSPAVIPIFQMFLDCVYQLTVQVSSNYSPASGHPNILDSVIAFYCYNDLLVAAPLINYSVYLPGFELLSLSIVS